MTGPPREASAAPIAQGILAALLPYRELLAQFDNGVITADQLEAQYLALYTDDPTDWPDSVLRVLDAFFFDVDDYVADDELRAEVGGIDATQLRTKAVETLERLDEPTSTEDTR